MSNLTLDLGNVSFGLNTYLFFHNISEYMIEHTR